MLKILTHQFHFYLVNYQTIWFIEALLYIFISYSFNDLNSEHNKWDALYLHKSNKEYIVLKSALGDIVITLVAASVTGTFGCGQALCDSWPLDCFRGRVRHGRHFTFKSVLGDIAITLVAASVTGTFVDADKPYVAHGPWLQVLIPEDFIDTLADSLEPLNNPDQVYKVLACH